MNINSDHMYSRFEFSVYANAILGSNFKGAKLINVLCYEDANKDVPIAHMNAQIYPSLPKGTPNDVTKYKFFEFELNGERLILANYWIIEKSIRIIDGMDYTIRLKDTTPEQVTKVVNQLNLLGIECTVE